MALVDDRHGLIVHAEAVNQTSDINQFAEQIDQANKRLDKPCEVACGDGGYADTVELKKIDEQGIQVVVPSQRQALHQEEKPFSKSHFRYAGQEHKSGKKDYRISEAGICQGCPHYGVCTTAKLGRKIVRFAHEQDKLRFEAQYEASQEIYDRRKTRAEHPFGHIKRNLKTDSFMLRGTDGVQAETSLLASCFDLRRVMTILGITALMEKLTALRVPAWA